MKNAWKRMIAFAMIFVIVFSNTGIANNYYVIAEQNNSASVNVPIVASAGASSNASANASSNASANASVNPNNIYIKDNNNQPIDSTELKEGIEILISADQCDDSWTVVINGKVEGILKQGVKYKIKEGNNIIRIFKNGVENTSFTKTIRGFSKHNYYVNVGENKYVITSGDVRTDSNKIVTGIDGFKGIVSNQTFIISDTQQNIEIQAAEIIKPRIVDIKIENVSSGNAYVGNKVKLTVSSDASGDFPNYNVWKCYAKCNDAEEDRINIQDLEYTMNKRGLYKFYFKAETALETKPDTTDPVEVTAYSKVEFISPDPCTDIELGENVYYTNERTIDVVYNIYSEDKNKYGQQEIQIDNESNKEKFSNLQLVLTVEIQPNDDGEINLGISETPNNFNWKNVKILDAFIQEKKPTGEIVKLDYFDIEQLKQDVRDWEDDRDDGDIRKLNIPILKPDLLIKPTSLYFTYFLRDLNWEDSDYSIYQVLSNNTFRDTEVLITDTKKIDAYNTLLQKSVIIESKQDGNGKYTLQIASGDKYYEKQYDNMNILFENNEYNGSISRAQETLDYERIKEYFTIIYSQGDVLDTSFSEGDEIQNKYRIGNKEVSVVISGNFKGYYPNVYFRKQEQEIINNRNKSLHNSLELGNLISGDFTPGAWLEKNEDVAYYDLIFSDEVNSIPTVGAIIRVIRETSLGKDDININLSNTLKDEDGANFHVINLIYNDKGVQVDFEIDNMDTDVKNDKIESRAAVFKKNENIVFELKSQDVQEKIQYGFIDLKGVTDFSKENIKTLEPKNLTNLTINSENKYTITAPPTEGIYVLYIKAINEQGTPNICISNGFLVDETAPESTKVSFIKKNDNSDDEEFTPATSEEKRNYFKQDGKVVAQFEFTDINEIDEPVINVIATDMNGNVIEEAEEKYDLDVNYVSGNATSDNAASGNAASGNAASGDILQKQLITLGFTKTANYTVQITAKDVAGNAITLGTYYFTIDGTNPIGQFTANGKKGKIDSKKDDTLSEKWYELVDTIIYEWFSKETADVQLTGSDKLNISDVQEYYYVANDSMSLDELIALDTKKWESNDDTKITVPANQRKLVYGKVVDKAGNTTYLNTQGLLTDTEKPDIIITAKRDANKNGFYNDDIVYDVKVEDFSDSVVKDYSGLQYVKYTVKNDKEISKPQEEYKNDKETAGEQKVNFPVKIDASKNNSNDIVLNVVAYDMAGNKYEKEQKLKIDNVKPEINVTFDNNNVTNEKYYHASRTATIHIKERNLNTNDVKIDIASEDGSKASIGKWTKIYDEDNPDETVYECKVTFSKDDDYQFNVSCVDMAGNESKGNHSSKFTIDTTTPVIDVSYSGNDTAEYRNHEVTATITITEHNFKASDVQVSVNAEDAANQPSVSEFRSEGDRHTATVHFTTDGTYQLSASYTDLASNAASSYEGEQFVIDLIDPKIEIQGVKDQSAYKDELKSTITFTDENYDESLVSLTVVGANNGNMGLETLKAVKSVVDKGEQYVIEFPKNSYYDDLYTLTATISDKAGNETQQVVQFSVNRYGSIYTLGDSTDAWLDSGVCAYIKEEKQVVIVETNVNDIESRSISYSLGGVNGRTVTIPELSECTKEEKNDKLYYEIEKNEQSNGWVQYEYKINAENFVEEGIYNITIHSKDSLGNEASNISNLHDDNKLTVQFAVDKTTPNVVFTGVEEDALYNEAEHTVLIDVQDNIALDQITVYLNGQEYGNYSAKDIESFDNQLVAVTVPQAKTKQSVQVAARDMAGNMIGDVTNSVANSACEEISFLVTTNKWIQFLNNSWLIVLIGVAGVSLVGGIVFVVMRKRIKK